MDNVIRPTFSKPREVSTEPRVAAEPLPPEHVPVRIYGTAAGYLVALLRDEEAAEGSAFKLAVGLAGGDTLETIAILPDTPGGEADAEIAGLAVLRALEVVQGAIQN